RVEHVLLDRLALGVLTGAFALLTALLAAVSAWSAWRRAGADDSPKLFFIGWKRLAGVLLAGLAVPLGLYWAWTRVLPFGGLRLGLYHFWQRMAEIGLLYLLVMFATTSATYQAVRRRCIEAGMEVGPPGHLNPLRNVRSGLAAAALCVGVGVVAFGLALLRLGDAAGSAAAGCGALAAVVAFPPLFVLWQLRHQGWRWRSVRTALALFGRGVISLPVAVMGAVSMAVAAVMALHYVLAINGESLRAILLGAGGLLIVVLAYLLARVAQSAPSDAGIGHFRRTLRRSMVPVLAAGVLALGLLSHAHLSWAEARQIALLSRPGVQLHDLEMTGFKEYGDHLRELNRRWLAESPLRSDAPSLPLAPVEP
ncbi:MAG: hypothetical protein KAX44_06175, partial [Candidatus Brocadiae bacterium]|nr:hypothetical protein [Candidatus Brocadiia bacterium]